MLDLSALVQVVVGIAAIVLFFVYNSILPEILRKRKEKKQTKQGKEDWVITKNKLGKGDQSILTRFEGIEDPRARDNEIYMMLLYMHSSTGGRTDGMERDWRLAFFAAFVIGGFATIDHLPWLGFSFFILAGMAILRPLWADLFSPNGKSS